MTKRPGRRLLRGALLAVVSLLGAAVLVEAFIWALLARPVRHPLLLPLARYYYFTVERDIIQYNPAAARWDAELFYTLRPGRFTFVQREFRHEFRINSMGLRDTEAALARPEIIAVGDSFTMGWGVGQDEAYPKLIEHAIDRRTLNAGIASYGTVRELLLLNRIDTSRLRYLIVQYNGDDVAENLAFWRQGNRHVSRPEERWFSLANKIAEHRRYFPGKYVWEGLYRLYRNLVVRRAHAESVPDEVDVFLNALTHAPRVDLRRVRVIVWATSSGDFVPALRAKLRHVRPSALAELAAVDIALGLDRRLHFWVLDDHLNALGHRVLAERLVEVIRRLDAGRPID